MNKIKNRLERQAKIVKKAFAFTEEDNNFFASVQEEYSVSDALLKTIKNAVGFKFDYDTVKKLFLEPSVVDDDKAEAIYRCANAFRDMISDDSVDFIVKNGRKLDKAVLGILEKNAVAIGSALNNKYDEKILDFISDGSSGDVETHVKELVNDPEDFKRTYHLAKLAKRNKIAKRMLKMTR
jgi:hypothetical protein